MNPPAANQQQLLKNATRHTQKRYDDNSPVNDYIYNTLEFVTAFVDNTHTHTHTQEQTQEQTYKYVCKCMFGKAVACLISSYTILKHLL